MKGVVEDMVEKINELKKDREKRRIVMKSERERKKVREVIEENLNVRGLRGLKEGRGRCESDVRKKEEMKKRRREKKKG